MKSVKILPMSLVALILTAFANPAAADDAALVEGEGTIHAVELTSNTLVINGVRFHVAFDARVEIQDNYGAFSMLQPGMKVAFEYRRHGPTNLEIFDIEQLSDNRRMEET
ncbi:MAG: hypothetical protein O7E57_09295, partial [Gammaproteobacteria bacterium]|nr:hypothetical protein [Gammaproteobacteria bacterium]